MMGTEVAMSYVIFYSVTGNYLKKSLLYTHFRCVERFIWQSDNNVSAGLGNRRFLSQRQRVPLYFRFDETTEWCSFVCQ